MPALRFLAGAFPPAPALASPYQQRPPTPFREPALPSRRSRHHLKLFTKPAVPGRVKTRLVGELSAEQTASLHRAFLADLACALRAGAFELSIAWAVAEGETLPDLGEVTGIPKLGRIPGERQRGADLGERLYHALSADSGAAEAGGGARLVAAIGSDHPELEAGRAEQAFRVLEEGADAVLGPSSDGGYYLIALAPRAVDRRLFEGIPWSTDRVCRATRRRAADLGLHMALLDPGHDVDVPADLTALCRRLETGTASCPRTRELLREWGWLGPRESSGGNSPGASGGMPCEC
ncbi:MAG: TIGR04282 family arsenosugar biosynthesis glycosyltransferase [Holophagales bacterium]|nr:TIGR04282 family arsenosugar biosynthesis glycosyltransferase [Holophagales bacterium]